MNASNWKSVYRNRQVQKRDYGSIVWNQSSLRSASRAELVTRKDLRYVPKFSDIPTEPQNHKVDFFWNNGQTPGKEPGASPSLKVLG